MSAPNEIVRATVENDETILLEWLPPDEGKPETYTLEKSEDGMSWFELSTFNKDEFSYEDYSVWVDDRPYWYRMNVTDSCQHTSDYSNIGKSILLKVDKLPTQPPAHLDCLSGMGKRHRNLRTPNPRRWRLPQPSIF